MGIPLAVLEFLEGCQQIVMATIIDIFLETFIPKAPELIFIICSGLKTGRDKASPFLVSLW